MASEETFIETAHQRELIERANQLAGNFSQRAKLHDEEAAFPFANFADLKKEGFLKLTVPEEFGGRELSLYDFLLVQEVLAKGDGATALSLGWHLGIIMNARETQKWKVSLFEKICREIVTDEVLVNTAATEAQTGSPLRGGKPATTAVEKNGHWVIDGRKTFTSLAPILDYFIVTATVEETGNIQEFLIPRGAEGLSVINTWNSLGMRATRSDDLVLQKVKVPLNSIMTAEEGGKQGMSQGWLLHIPACYLGIAQAARNYAVEFAKTYQPSSLPHPIKEVPEVRRKTARMEADLLAARHVLYGTARKWDSMPAARDSMKSELALAKTFAVNAALNVVDNAMRIVGGLSLSKDTPLERLYRDVRAGLHNPPADDITYDLLANEAFSDKC
ncbi:acyl-CoA dehydrogenase [Bacillus lacus]|uniref:Acyl-CoA dehydrogenase n=1 Tax=Metabacillus lacus TaxID=1983721 RepID=A0A7X2IXT4_9BACI|nr:acyl-CoA dehydrogenase family protein [Metabacillus lacus]MRX71639.1 acyl-CoA dehydrogenase [Metabacillus lacus]